MLRFGERLLPGNCLHSPSGNVALCMMPWGQLELRQFGRGTVISETLWYSPSSPGLANASLVMAPDGALQIDAHASVCDACETYMWRVSFSGGTLNNATQLEVRDVCDFVLASGEEVLWTSGTACVSTDLAWPLSLGIAFGMFAFCLFLVCVWATCFCQTGWVSKLKQLHCSKTGESPPVLSVDSVDGAESFLEFQDRQTRVTLLASFLLFCLALIIWSLMISTKIEPGYNYVPVCVGFTVLGLNFVVIAVLSPAIRLTKNGVASTCAKALRIFILVLGNVVITMSLPLVQHALADRFPLYDLMGSRPACENFLERRMNGVRCAQRDIGTMLHFLHMLVHIIFVLPVRQACCYAVLSLCAFMLEYIVISAADLIEIVTLSCGLAGLLVTKRRLDSANFEVFSELIARKNEVIQERVKRYLAEFRCENPKATGQHTETRFATEQSSCHSDATGQTTETQALFQQLVACQKPLPNILRVLEVLGEEEHWLIRPADIEVLPDCDSALGMGSFGLVQRALWHGATVAIKIIELETHASSNLVTMLNEVRILRHVRHPNIAHFFGVVVDHTTCMIRIVLELVEGNHLGLFMQGSHSACRDISVNLPKVSFRHDLMNCICQGLRYLHERKPTIVHGDLKPANILVTADALGLPRRAKLVDFGLSRLLSGSTRPLGGTLRWMAPEVLCSDCTSAEHEPLQPATSADIYSFGLILYFMATGTKPSVRRTDTGSNTIPISWPHLSGIEDESQRMILSFCEYLVGPMLNVIPQCRPTAMEVKAQLAIFSDWKDISDIFGLERPVRLDTVSQQRFNFCKL